MPDVAVLTTSQLSDDDDGVMVLRRTPGDGLDLAAPITCEARAGDAW